MPMSMITDETREAFAAHLLDLATNAEADRVFERIMLAGWMIATWYDMQDRSVWVRLENQRTGEKHSVNLNEFTGNRTTGEARLRAAYKLCQKSNTRP